MEKNSGRDFMEKTKHKNMGVSDQQMHLPQPPLGWPAEPVNPKIELPHPGSLAIEPVDIRLLITQRSSLREYAEKPLALEELSHMLWCTQGVKVAYDQQMTLRTVPSAGARHALETILLVNRVEGLESGLYRYLALDHQLELISTLSNIAGRLAAACFGQRFIMRSAVTFVWIAVPYRMTWRYQERGYRYLHLDAGHVCQNLYLAAEAIDAGVCAVAAFDDDEINTLLCLDPEEAFVIYLAAVGKKMKG